jgi:hypothetical protein
VTEELDALDVLLVKRDLLKGGDEALIMFRTLYELSRGGS